MFEKITDQVGTLARITLADIFDNKQLPNDVNNEIRELINNTSYRQYSMRNSMRNAEDLIKRADITLSLKLLEEIAIKQVQINYIGTNITNMIAGTIYDTAEDLTTLTDDTQKNIIHSMLNVGWCTSTMGAASFKKAIFFNNVIKGASFLNKFKKLDISKGNTNGMVFERVKELELELMENRFDNTIAIKVKDAERDTEAIIVLTNRHTWKKVRKTVSKTMDLFEGLTPAGMETPFYNKIKFLFEKLGNTTSNDNTAWQETFISAVQDTERTKQKAIMELEKLLEYTRKERVSEIQRHISSLKSSIKGYEDNIRKCYEEQRDAEGQLLRIEDDPELKAKIIEAMEYSQKSKLISKMNIQAQNKTIQVVIDAPIRYFDPEYAKALYRNMTSDGEISKKSDKKIFKELFKGLFIDDKYTLCCSTVINVMLYSDRSSNRPIDFAVNRKTEQEVTYLTQPHLNGYSCFGNNKIEAYKACEKFDLLGLLTVFTTSAQNLNLTDSTVFSHFREQLLSYGATKKTIKNNETGEMFSFNEFYYNNIQTVYKSPKTKVARANYERDLTDEEYTHLLKALKALKTVIVRPMVGLNMIRRLYEIGATTNGDAGSGNFYMNADRQNHTIQLLYDGDMDVVYASKSTKEYFDLYNEHLSTNSDKVPNFYTALLDDYHGRTETNEETTQPVDEAVAEAVAEELAMPF